MRSTIATAALLVGVACAPPRSATPYPLAEPEAGEAPLVESSADVAEPPNTARFLDRRIDLEPFIAGFPYADFVVDLEHAVMMFVDKRAAYTLRRLELGDLSQPKLDLAAAQAISDVDWSRRGLRTVRLHPASNTAWLVADRRNDEKFNLWTLSLDTKDLVQITDTDYIYGFGFNEDESQIAYVGRRGTKAPFRTCVYLLDVRSKQERELACDSGELSFVWGRPVFSPDDRELFLNAQIDGDRNRAQLVRVDLRATQPRPRLVTDRKVGRNGPRVLEGWLGGDSLVFVANDDGYRNVYAYSRKRQKVRQLTRYQDDVGAAALTSEGVFLAHGTPRGSMIELIDAETGEARVRGAVRGSVSILDAHERRVVWTQGGPGLVFEANVTELKENGGEIAFHNRRVIKLDPKLSEQIVQCQAEPVEIPTFDQDPQTGQARLLHAFVLKPKSPLPEGQRLALVRSFYGGANAYNRYDHIMCAAGILIVSPAVRGSHGFGRTFSSLNDKDLGGDEIVDLFYVARWAETKFDLRPEQIGVYGRSHGGYATMRALTFPPQTNGRNESYPFGFGLAEAGFSDIKAFHDASNIPDWVVLEAGDPTKPEELARLVDRSPLYHVDRLNAPLFLLHGANDWRVPVDGSRAFAAAAKKVGGMVEYAEFEGQGHHVEGLERIADAFQARFDFLMSLPSMQAEPTEAPSDDAR